MCLDWGLAKRLRTKLVKTEFFSMDTIMLSSLISAVTRSQRVVWVQARLLLIDLTVAAGLTSMYEIALIMQVIQSLKKTVHKELEQWYRQSLTL